MKYAFVSKYSDQLPVVHLCAFVNVSPSSYYRWVHNPVSKRDLNNFDLDAEIEVIFNEHKGRYGAKRIYETLKDNDWKVTVERVSKRMKLMNLIPKAARKHKATTDSNHNNHVSDNIILQDFKAQRPNQKWVTDITYIRTQEGWLYLCVFIDLFSRRVIGWSMNKRMKADLVCNALKMAMFRRGMPEGVIVHADKGSQYCSDKFQKLIKDYNLTSSMSGKGCCYDNAACESFFGTLKIELVYDEDYLTREAAKTSIFEYMELYYNAKRKHSTINYMTPNEFEYMIQSEHEKCPKLTG